MRILLIEDDSLAAQSIAMMLSRSGMKVDTAGLGEDGIELAKVYDYDLILLDLHLPDMNGLEVLRKLRTSKLDTPVLILSATAEVGTKVRVLTSGADDYLTKPFHKDELIARVQAVVRRSMGHAESTITTGAVTVHLDSKSVTVDGANLYLTSKEYQILELLSLRKGSTLTKEMFLNHLYGSMDEPEAKIVDVFICKLRKKLGAATGKQHNIETVWGRGYILRDPPSAKAAA